MSNQLHIDFITAGEASPINVWDKVDGKNVQTDVQQRDENGLPLWKIPVFVKTGKRVQREQTTLKLASASKPDLEDFTPVEGIRDLGLSLWKGNLTFQGVLDDVA